MDQIIEASAWTPLSGDNLADIVLLFVRVIFGIVYLYYGIPKLRDLSANAVDFEEKGFKPGWFWGTPIALLETFGSLAMMVGFFTWFFAIAFVIHMATGMTWKITSTDKKFPDWSYDLILLCLSLLFLVLGAGDISLSKVLQ